MSARAKFRAAESAAEDGESYFVSMTDLMTGFLFVFIIMLMFFVLQFSSATTQLVSAEDTRKQILEDIRSRLEEHGVRVFVDDENGILRLPEELLFSKSRADITEQGREAVAHIASAMSIVLPCHAGESPPSNCKPSPGGRLETVLVEGHTDSDPVKGGPFGDNWELSAFRAINTYQALTLASSELRELRNDSGKAVLGVSGYGEFRPLNANFDEEQKKRNRRIDLRFIMEAPRPPIVVEVQNEIESQENKEQPE